MVSTSFVVTDGSSPMNRARDRLQRYSAVTPTFTTGRTESAAQKGGP